MNRILKIVAIVIAVLIVLLVAIPFFIDVNTFRPEIESQLSSSLGRQVKVGNLKLSILSGSVGADDLTIADDPSFSNQPFIRAKALDVGVEVMPLIFSKTLNVTELTVNEPQVSLLRNAAGRWNFSSLGNKPGVPAQASAPQGSPTPEQLKNVAQTKPQANLDKKATPSANQDMSVGKLNIKSGTISMGNVSTRQKPQVYSNVDVTVTNFVFNSKFPFNLSAGLPGGGTAKLDGTAGPIDPADASLTPVEAKVAVQNLDIAGSGFVDPASGIAGIANFNGTVQTNGRQAQSAGTAVVNKLKASPKGSPAPTPVNLKYTVVYELQKQSGDLTEGDVTIGKAVAKLSGGFQIQPTTTVLNMKLNAANMPVDDLEPMLPALGVTLPSGSSLKGGTLTANFTIVGPVDKLVIIGPVQLVNTKLTGFDLGSKLSAVSALSGAKTGSDTVIQNLSTNAKVAPEGISTDNVNLTIPSLGVVTGSGTISPQNALNYHMAAKLSGNTVTGVSQMVGLGNQAASVPFFIQGTTSDPKFVPDVKGLLNNQLGGLKGNNPSNVVNGLTGLFGGKKK